MEIRLSGLPHGSKLILIGDWFRKPGEGWMVVCYFLDNQNKAFRKAMPVDLLPTLIPGTVYPRSNIESKSDGYTGTFMLPKLGSWTMCRYRELPNSLKRMRKYSNEIDDQIVWRLNSGNRVMWLPAAELARMLFFHSSEVLRAAVYQGNTWQLAKSEHKNWIGEIIFTSNVPATYLKNHHFMTFFAWLLFDTNAEKSFCSIFDILNSNSFIRNDHEGWRFEFKPPDLSYCEISWSGYTGSESKGEKNHCYIREIRSINGLTFPNLQTIFFSHPDDTLYLENETQEEPSTDKGTNPHTNIDPKEINPGVPPKPGRKRHLLNLTSSGLHFDVELDLQRRSRQIKFLPKGEKPDLEMPEIVETLGITEGSDYGENPRADIDNLSKQELIEAPEKMRFFQTMLNLLENQHGWQVEIHTGDVPRNNCRSTHLINGRRRQYCHGVLRRDADSIIQILEIELKKDESLSTFLYRAINIETTLENILHTLMTSDASLNYKAMQWKRRSNTEITVARHYLEHPDKKIISEEEALESWVARAAEKIMRM